MTIISTNWLNQMNTLRCEACQHEWIQPALVGKCPKCHSEKTKVIEQRVNALPRV